MATKNRSDLKSYFVKNAIPTEGNFADLIDSQLNQTQDGVFKPDGEALSVVAASGPQKRVLRLFASYPAANPDWMISLNPAQDPAKADTISKLGFGITDGTGKTRLFIDAATGQIGVGTNTPSDILHVRNAGTVGTVGLFESSTTQATLQLATSEGTGNYVGFANRSGGNAAISVGTGGDALIVRKDGGVVVSKASGGVGDLTVEKYLRFPNENQKDKILFLEDGTTNRYGIGLNTSNINLFCPTSASFSLRQNNSSGTEVFSVSGTGTGTLSGANGSLMIRRDVSGQLGPKLTLLNGGGGAGTTAAIDFCSYDPGTNDPALRVQAIDVGGFANFLKFSFKKSGANTNKLVDRLLLEDNGELTIYFDQGYWRFQTDGNLVKFRKDGTVIWALQTGGSHLW